MPPFGRIFLAIAIILPIIGGYLTYRWLSRGSGSRLTLLRAWFRDPGVFSDRTIRAGERCGDAPFTMPTDGFVGILWGDSFRPGRSHQGIDIFSGTPSGEVPVIAAYAGYLTRLSDWRSAVIIRSPEDPLNPGRQIWTYYTHMADQFGNTYIDPQFPPGTSEIFVEAGAFLGYQGNYSGNPINPTGVHLHFSIVKDDGNGRFMNELEIRNTNDPSPYLGLPLNAATNKNIVPVCS